MKTVEGSRLELVIYESSQAGELPQASGWSDRVRVKDLQLEGGGDLSSRVIAWLMTLSGACSGEFDIGEKSCSATTGGGD